MNYAERFGWPDSANDPRLSVEVSMEITIEKNEDYQLNITDIGENGEGIGRIDGLTTFVQGAVPGDVVKAKIIKLKKQYAIGKLVEIVEASEMRREPSCQYAKECGGCQVQHIDYKSQLELKKKIVVDALTRIGKIENVQVNDVLGMETPYHYRNKGQYPIKRVDGKVCIGFYKQRTHDIVDINTCELQNPLNDKVIEILRKFIEDNKIEIYNERTKKGLVRHLIIRVAKDTNDLMVVLVANGKRIPKEDLLVKALTEMPEVKSIILNINRESGNKIVGNRNISLFGDEKIVDHIGDLAFNISPLSLYILGDNFS